jgi:hypothetical protein
MANILKPTISSADAATKKRSILHGAFSHPAQFPLNYEP